MRRRENVISTPKKDLTDSGLNDISWKSQPEIRKDDFLALPLAHIDMWKSKFLFQFFKVQQNFGAIIEKKKMALRNTNQKFSIDKKLFENF